MKQKEEKGVKGITENEAIEIIDWLINNWKEEYAKNSSLNSEYDAKLDELNMRVAPINFEGVSVIRRSLCRISTENGNVIEDLRDFWNSQKTKTGPIEHLLSTIALMPWRKATITVVNDLHIKNEEVYPIFKKKYPRVGVVIDFADAGNFKVMQGFRNLNVFYFWFPLSDKRKMEVNVLFSVLSILNQCEKQNYYVLINGNPGSSHSSTILNAFSQINDRIGVYAQENYAFKLNDTGVESLNKDQLYSFLKRIKKYFDGKADFIGNPQDWCMEGIVE